MVSAQSDSAVGVVIPLRSLDEGKTRLDPALSTAERRALIVLMATQVVDAAHQLPVWIVHQSPEVAAFAEDHGASAVAVPEPGLDHAVREGIRHAAAAGCRHVIIAHADLPSAKDLRPAAVEGAITIVTDRHGTGTNVLSLPTDLPFDFSFGEGSARRHLIAARQTGCRTFLVDAPDLAFDVDELEDLTSDLRDRIPADDPEEHTP